MSRQEDFDKYAIKTAETISHQWGTGGLTYADLVSAGNECAEYGYQYAVEKVCDILNHYCNRTGVHPSRRVDIINHIRKEMEE